MIHNLGKHSRIQLCCYGFLKGRKLKTKFILDIQTFKLFLVLVKGHCCVVALSENLSPPLTAAVSCTGFGSLGSHQTNFLRSTWWQCYVTVLIHRFVRDKYCKRFPELESLVMQPQEYMMTVRELGNDLDKAKNNEALHKFLTQATIMVVSVTASTTQGLLFFFFL